MPLSMASIGNTRIIERIVGDEKVKNHLEHMGFVPGEKVTIVSELNGSLILHIKDSRVAVNRVMATQILVQ